MAPETYQYPFDSPEHPLALTSQYEHLRHTQPVAPLTLPDGHNAWLVTGYHNCRKVFGRQDLFTRGDADAIAPFPRLSGLLLTLDGPEHSTVRAVAKGAFTPERVETYRPGVEALTQELLDHMIAAGPPADLVTALALPLPLGVIGAILGIPEPDRPQFRTWGDGLLSAGDNSEQESLAATQQMSAYLGDLIAQRRRQPASDLLSELIERADAAGLTNTDLIMLAIGLTVAGWQTTASAIATFTYTLLTHPTDQNTSYYRYLHQHSDAIPTAVEELLRTIPNAQLDAQPRRATRDLQLGDVQIHAGDLLIPAHDAANRDAAVFNDPDTFDISRTPNPHLAFGHGPHFCLGAPLARLELRTVLTLLTSQLPNLTLAIPAEQIPWETGITLRGPQHLPVTWEQP